MKKLLLLALFLTCLTACQNKEADQANALLQSAQKSLQQGDYLACMDSISKLRAEYPQEVEARKAAMPLWNQAQLLLAQHEIAHCDSLMLAIDSELSQPDLTLLRRNTLHYRRDSLKSRYDVNVAIVRKIKVKSDR